MSPTPLGRHRRLDHATPSFEEEKVIEVEGGLKEADLIAHQAHCRVAAWLAQCVIQRYWKRLDDWARSDAARVEERLAMIHGHRALMDRVTEKMTL